VSDHVEVIGAHDVQDPAVQLAERWDDAVVGALRGLEAESVVE